MTPITLTAAVVAIALRAPVPYERHPEPADERAARVTMIGVSAVEAALSDEGDPWPWDRASLALAALDVTWHESQRWIRWVHAAPWVRDVRGTRATCLGQLHPTPWVPIAEWRTLAGTDADSTRRCMAAVVRVLSRHAARCRVGDEPTEYEVGRVIAAYGTGKGCPRAVPRWAAGRAWIWGQWTRRLVELELAAEGESDSGDATMRREIEL